MRHSKRNLVIQTTRAALLLLATTLVLSGPAGAVMDLSWFTVDGGGWTFSTGAALSLGGTIGQPDAGGMGSGTYALLGGFWKGGWSASGIEETQGSIPLVFRIAAGVPNPFTTSTSLLLDLPEARFVHVRVFDQSGRMIRSLCGSVLPGGHHQIIWDGLSEEGHRVASGVYLLRVEAGSHVLRRSVVLIR